mmetsp:Transcript_3075/g.5426  ORF Transcript_3075/g.5426 Transcript_3075/m.5426 type:complete len:128 (-) Transcript_3075:718-1101(-)
MDSEEKRKSVSAVKGLLLQSLKVKLRDGRWIIGRFECLDSSMNLLLSSAEEHAPVEPEVLVEELESKLEQTQIDDTKTDTNPVSQVSHEVEYERRRVGLVIIPGDQIDSVFRTDQRSVASTISSCFI